MFTKKLEDQFSADLLNAVRGVLGEAKKCPENCECEKCEAEDDDEMKEGFANAAQRKAVWASKADGGAGHPDKKKKMKKEGYMPAADEPSAKDKKTAQKIRDMMAKEKKPVKEDAEELDELSKPTMGRYINKAKDSIDMTSYRSGIKDGTAISSSKPYTSNNPLEKKLSKRHKGIETAVKKLTKEDAEQIDELSKGTMGRYVNKAADRMSTQGVTAGLKIAADEKSKKNFDNIAKRQKGIATAVKKLTKEEQDFIDALNTDTLEEGRGRPPKEGSAAWKARQGKADDDMVALGMQLRKAHSINKKVRFMDGKEHDIHPTHITRFNDHMGARRTTQEKDNFQRQAHKSHADFVKAVSAPVPKAAKDTGEIVKYR